ncbi:hypothetical protein ACWDT6_19900 [Nocardia grenadensis]
MRPTDTDSVDAVLDAGAEGLRFFEVFLPRYREWTGHDPAGGDYFALAARYDQQRGTDLESLRALATVLGEELEGNLSDQAATQTTRFGAVSAAWNGSAAADNAQQFLTDTATTVTTNLDTLRAVHTATTTAVTQIDEAVRTKADTIKAEFDPDTAAGKTPQQIDWFIDLAQGRGDTGQSAQDRLRSELPEYDVDGSEPAAACRTWLDQVFIAEIDAKIARFTTVCSHAHTTVTGAYEQLATAVEEIEPTAFRSPGGTPTATTALTPTAGQPSYLAAVGSQPASTDPDSTSAPVGKNPAQTSPAPPQDPTAQDAPSSLALTSTPAAAQISETAGLGTESTTGLPAGTDSDDTGDSSTAGDPGLGLDDSATREDSALGAGDPAATPPAATGTTGEWTPADITGMVTAIGTITGTIPDMITAVSGLVGNLDEVITATGEATATIIDAVDNQPAAPAGPVEGDPSIPAVPEDGVATGDQGQDEEPTLEVVTDSATGEETAGLTGEENPVETPTQGVEDGTGSEEAPAPQLPEPTPPLEPASDTNPAMAASFSSLRGLTRTSTDTDHRRGPVFTTASTPEPASTLSL